VCGFVGLIGQDDVAPSIYMALQAIQHRGQDAAGIGTHDDGFLNIHKDVGMVSHALPPSALATLTGTSGIGHVRYPTLGSNSRGDAQPFMTRRPSIVLAHNGNVTNIAELEEHLVSRGMRMTSHCDSEPILLVFGDELLKIRVAKHTEDDVVAALKVLMDRVKGSYSVAAIMAVDGKETLIAFRDPHGIRPSVYGTRGDGAWMVASESVSLDVLEFAHVGHVPPGSVVLMRKGEEPIIRNVNPQPLNHCVFEDIYFARPDSVMESGRVYSRRRIMGQKLAEEWAEKGLEADVIVAVPDTSRPAAQAMSEALNLPNREGFIKNRYSGRTFIMPDQATREAAMRLKLNPIDEIFRGQRVIMVDDSIVRGTTMRRMVDLVRRHEPAAIHVAIFSPPVRNPCFYGIDMPSRAELVASQMPEDELEERLAEKFGTDSVTFLSRRGLLEVAGNRICAACFTGVYPIPVNEDERGYILKERRPA